MSDTSEFWKALANHTPRPKVEFEYRVYYKGTTIQEKLCNITDAEWPEGDYIKVTKEEFNLIRPLYNRVVDGKLIKVSPRDPRQRLLEKDTDGDYTSRKDNIIFVAENGDNYKRRI